ncbi:hypothetical protein MRB53_039961 [Persea americana]|nr:hypothetical protein MRB53_039961 [Persea americana]
MHAHSTDALGVDMSRLTIHEADRRSASQSEEHSRLQEETGEELDASGDTDGDSDGGVLLPSTTTLRISTDVPTTTADSSPASASLREQFETLRPTSTHRPRSPFSRHHLRSRSSGAALGSPSIMRAHLQPGDECCGAQLRAGHANRQSRALVADDLSALPRTSALPLPTARRLAALVRRVRSRPRQRHRGHPRGQRARHQPGRPTATSRTIPTSILLPLILSSAAARPHPSTLSPHSPPHSPPSARAPPRPLPRQRPAPPKSPSLGPQRFNELYPSLHHYASISSFSSISSTPSSQRSRSPSISSLETIEDAPDLESKAIEAERIDRLKLAADRADRADHPDDPDDQNPRCRAAGFGFGRASNRERKRWSVCGGERRADLDLETIYED